jgi:hypothetical protein
MPVHLRKSAERQNSNKNKTKQDRKQGTLPGKMLLLLSKRIGTHPFSIFLLS